MSGDPGAAGPTAHDPYAVLRDRGFRRFMLAGMMATVGTHMLQIAVAWELYERTRSPLSLGLVGLVQVVPILLLAIPAGHAADRYSRARQVVVAQALLLVASLGLALLSALRGPVGWTYALMALTGIGHSLYRPARSALLPQIVPRDRLLSAITWNSSGWQIAAMFGPSLGGLIIALTGGAVVCYLLHAALTLAVVVLFGSLRVGAAARGPEPISTSSLLAGLRFVIGTDLILATITLDLLAVFLGGATALLPVFARDILAIGPTGLGWLRAAPSVGSFATALVLAHRPPLRRAGKALLWSVAGYGLAMIVFGLSRNPYLSFAMLLLSGAFDNISVVVRHTLVQVLTPDAMRGRVSAINAIFIASSNELGEFESGITARLFGTVLAVVGGGIGTLLVVAGSAWAWPSLLALGSLHEVRERHHAAEREESQAV